MSYPNRSVPLPDDYVILVRWQKWRLFVGMALLLIGAAGTIYGVWVFKTVDGTSMEQPVQGDTTYHPANVVLAPILAHAAENGWTAQETAGLLNRVTQGLTIVGGSMFLAGIFLIFTSRRRMLGIPRYTQEPMASESV